MFYKILRKKQQRFRSDCAYWPESLLFIKKKNGFLVMQHIQSVLKLNPRVIVKDSNKIDLYNGWKEMRFIFWLNFWISCVKRKVYRSASLSAGKSENEIQQIKASKNIIPHKYLRLSNSVSHFSPTGTRLINCGFAKAVATFANSYRGCRQSFQMHEGQISGSVYNEKFMQEHIRY